jgi:hypothetical protein
VCPIIDLFDVTGNVDVLQEQRLLLEHLVEEEDTETETEQTRDADPA